MTRSCRLQLRRLAHFRQEPRQPRHRRLPKLKRWNGPGRSLPELLAYAPDRLSDGSLPLNDVVRYANIARWSASGTVTVPSGRADPQAGAWLESLAPLALPAALRERGLDPAWASAYGFDLTQVDQVLVVGHAPDYVMVLRGRFDPQTLQDAWVTSGYQPVEVQGATAWSLYPEDQVDLSAPESRPGMGTLNNVLLLDDGTLITAARSSHMAATVKVIAGDAPSLAQHEHILPLLDPGAPLVSAVISKGSLLQGTSTTMPQPSGSTPSTPGGVAEAMPVEAERCPRSIWCWWGFRRPRAHRRHPRSLVWRSRW